MIVDGQHSYGAMSWLPILAGVVCDTLVCVAILTGFALGALPVVLGVVITNILDIGIFVVNAALTIGKTITKQLLHLWDIELSPCLQHTKRLHSRISHNHKSVEPAPPSITSPKSSEPHITPFGHFALGTTLRLPH
jgi:hypothetical protein